MFCKKSFCEIYKVDDNFVVRVRPIVRELKGVARFFGVAAAVDFVNMGVAGGVGIVFCMRSVGYNEKLHKLKKPTVRPKTIALVSIYLVKGFTDSDSTAF